MNPVIIGNATQKPTAIYALCEWPSLAPRYVGKTTQYIIDRRKAHIRDAQRGGKRPVHYWLRKRMHGGGFALKLLEHVPSGDDWSARERYWISRFRAEGFSLLNLTDGGEGLSGHIFSAEHKRKISLSLKKGRDVACRKCGLVFWAQESRIKAGDGVFCCKACYQSWQKGRTKNSVFPASAIESAAIKRRSMTECKRGHQLSGENLYVTKSGGRVCKACRKVHKATYKAKNHG